MSSVEPTPAAPSRAYLSARDQAFSRAWVEVSSRTGINSVILLSVCGALYAMAGADNPGREVLGVGFVALAATTLARLATLWWTERRPAGRRQHVIAIGGLTLHMALWAVFASVAVWRGEGTLLPEAVLTAQCLGAVAAAVRYAAVRAVAYMMISFSVVPVALVILVRTLPDVSHSTAFAVLSLVYVAVLLSLVPRLHTDRWSSTLSLTMLEQQAASLAEARDTALQAVAAKDAFLANLSHEIRTPLHGILGLAEAMRRSSTEPGQHKQLVQMISAGHALLRTLNDALDAVRLEGGQLRLREEPFVIDRTLGDAVATFEAEAEQKGVALSFSSHAGGVRVLGDPDRLRQVLSNLVGNAIKFTPAGGEVRVTAETALAGNGVELTVDVTDTGVGFEAREAARLFQRFSQLADGARSGGTGLGLAISKELVALMGGEIDATSPGRHRGASFRIVLPFARVALQPIAGRRVLVVDDSPVNVAIARGYLEGLGCAVDEASGGVAAVERASQTAYDAILMDCQMPDLDGFEATRMLRARGDNTPVLAITATDETNLAQRCANASINGFVVKPVSPEGLHAALDALLDKGAPRAQDADVKNA